MLDRFINKHRKANSESAGDRPGTDASLPSDSPKREGSSLGNQQTLRALGVRAKLSVSQPSDPEEAEADQLADQFVGGGHISRKCADCGDDDGRVMRKAEGASARAPSMRAGGIGDGGRPLAPAVRRSFETFYRADFSRVRIHANSEANQSAKTLNARAYTQGQDIVFAAGEFAPHTRKGEELLAHELAHVVQHGRRGDSQRVARQPDAPPGMSNNPVLTPDEMFEIVKRERAWSFNPGGGAVNYDPAGVGRGVGAAAGGRRAGFSVFAVIQVTDADGRPVALSYGEHISYGDPHAEQRAVAGLRREIPTMRDISGGRMTVVLDQTPCPPGRSNCMGLLQQFARERGLHLEVHLPTRQSMVGTGSVAPRTAAMSSMRTDVPHVSLNRYYPPGTTPPTNTGGGGPPPPVPPTTRPTGPVRFVPPRSSSAPSMQARASLLAKMQAQTQRGIRLNARISLISRGITGVLSVLGTLETLQNAQRMFVHGTLFPEVEAQVDSVGEYGREMEQWAMETTGELSFLGAMAAIADADERDDAQALFEIDDQLTSLYTELYDKANQFRDFAIDLRWRERALDIMKDFYKTLISVPMGISTAPNADAFAMYESLQRLSGRLGSAATHFEEADRILRYDADNFSELARQANDKAWDINLTRMAVAMREAERERSLDARIQYERRLNEIDRQLETIDAELNRPMSRPQDVIDRYRQRRDALMFERALLNPWGSR